MFVMPLLMGGGIPGEGNDLIGTMSGYTLGAITVSAQDELSTITRAWEAFDKDSGERWVSSTIPSWLKVDFGSSQVVYSYMLQGSNSTRDPAAWTFEGSDDDSAWTTLDTRSGIGQSSSERSFSLGSMAEYRYYRWNFTASNGDARIGINEAQIRD